VIKERIEEGKEVLLQPTDEAITTYMRGFLMGLKEVQDWAPEVKDDEVDNG